MKELWRKFWTKESYAIRLIRLAVVSIGGLPAILTTQDVAVPGWVIVVGAVAAVVGATLSGTDKTPTGIPTTPPPRPPGAPNLP